MWGGGRHLGFMIHTKNEKFVKIHLRFVFSQVSSSQEISIISFTKISCIGGHVWLLIDTKSTIFIVRAPDNFQVQRVITPYFWKSWVFAYFLCTVVLSTAEKIAYMYTFKIMLNTSVIQ
jgi:hypothetical protein